MRELLDTFLSLGLAETVARLESMQELLRRLVNRVTRTPWHGTTCITSIELITAVQRYVEASGETQAQAAKHLAGC